MKRRKPPAEALKRREERQVEKLLERVDSATSSNDWLARVPA